MLTVSTRTLKLLAAALWIVGGGVLIWKGGSLLVEAAELKVSPAWPWLGAAVGLGLGSLKAKYLFARSCRRNLDRIDALERPKPWQFYSPKFFLMLTIMITAGATLSRLAHGNYAFLIAVGILDLSIATALLTSSLVYWQQQAFGVRG